MKVRLLSLLLFIIVIGLYASPFIGNMETLQDVNPALLTEMNQKTFTLLHTRQNRDDTRQVQWSFASPVGLCGLYQTYAFFHRISFLKDWDASAHLAGVSYAFNVWRQLSVGATVGGVYEKNSDSSSLKLDAGMSWRFSHPVTGEHLVGIAVRDMFTKNTRFSQPENVNFSWWMKFFEGKVRLCSDVTLAEAFTDDRYMTFDSRLGFYLSPFSLALSAGENRLGCSLGLFSTWFNNSNVYLNLNYSANVKSVRTKEFGVQAAVSFLRSREEMYGKVMGRTCCLTVTEPYNRGVIAFRGMEYFRALNEFSFMVREYPDFFKVDWCQWFIGCCYAELGMLQIAKIVFNEAIYMSVNPYVNLFIYKNLFEIALEEQDEDGMKKYTDSLFPDYTGDKDSNPTIVDSIKNEMHFMYAEYLFSENRFTEALAEYQLVGSDHSKWPNARIAIAALLRHLGKITESYKTLALINRNDSLNIHFSDKDSTGPVTFVSYDSLRMVIESEAEVVMRDLDSSGAVMFEVLQKRNSEKTLAVLDSLHGIQRKLFATVERKRLLRNPLYKKWQMLGKDLLQYINEDEFELLLRSHLLVAGYGKQAAVLKTFRK